jgi:hypothetical protein
VEDTLRKSGASGPVGTRSLQQPLWRKSKRATVLNPSSCFGCSTCFWAGDAFTPKLKVKDASGQEVSIQTFLQDAFLGAWEALAKAVGDLDSVIGFEVRPY